MMTREMVLELLATVEADVTVDADFEDGSVEVIVDDFDGFDEEWSEIYRELEDAEAVNAVYDRLKAEALSVDGDFYRYFHFDGFTVCWGYASMDV